MDSRQVYPCEVQDLLVEAELVEEHVASFVVVPERLEQYGSCLGTIVWNAGWSKQRRWGLHTGKQSCEYFCGGWDRRKDNLWGCRGSHWR